MLPKVAVVVFVKNEYPDFCAWLAWYVAIGVDTIIVYDDHSTDGTWEAALAASRCFDVRPLRTDRSVRPFTARQRETYLAALRLFRDQFDWIGFLDADEYLYLRTASDLPSFLAGFPHAAAIAFSWCIYGSNGHLLKPSAPTVEAFTRHSSADFEHNRSVKSFVRPRLAIDRWRDPHTFDVGGGAYLDPRGQPVRWGGPGAINHPPDWSVAKLMHFIPRSMEHFVERVRRRSDLQGHTNEYWSVFNVNEIEDKEPLRLLPQLYRNLFRINAEIMRDCLEAAREASARASAVAPGLPGPQPPRAWRALTHFGTDLGVDSLGQLVNGRPEALLEAGCQPVILVGAAQGQACYLLAPEAGGPIRIKNDHRVCDVLGFEVSARTEGGQVSLRTPGMSRYLTALPPDAAGIGATSGDRWNANAWEHFTLLPSDAPADLERRCPGLGVLAAATPSPDTIQRLVETGGGITACMAAMQFLPPRGRRGLAGTEHATLPARHLPGWI